MDDVKRKGRTKVNKPLAERRRRARINDALLQLKSIVLQSIGNETTVMSKLEKADILEMAVQYIHNIQGQQSLATPQYAIVSTDPQCSTVTVDPQCSTVYINPQCATVSCDPQCSSVSIDPQFSFVSCDPQTAAVPVDPQFAPVSVDTQYSTVSRGTHCSTVSVGPQCAAISVEPQYEVVSGNSQYTTVSIDPQYATIPVGQCTSVSVDSQYATGFTVCAAHVANHINSVTENVDTENSNSNEDISTRLLEHLVNVTPNKNLFTRDEQQQQSPSHIRHPDGQCVLECDTDKRASSDIDTPETVDHSKSPKVEKMENSVGNVNDTSAILKDVSPKPNYSKTVPKKRRLFNDSAKVLSSGNCYKPRNKENIEKQMHTTSFDEALPKIRANTRSKSSPVKKSRTVPKPIKKRIAALVAKRRNTTENYNEENDHSAVTLVKNSCTNSVNTVGMDNVSYPFDSIFERSNSTTSASASTKEVGLSSVDHTPFGDRSRCDENVLFNKQTQLGYGLHLNAQKENETPLVNEKYITESTHRNQYRYNSDEQRASADSDNIYNFYQGFFVNAFSNNVWRPW